jgi:hypothetical protein
MDTNEQVETQITYPDQPTQEDGKPMNTPWIISGKDGQGNVWICDCREIVLFKCPDFIASSILQAVNRAPAFDAMVEALEFYANPVIYTPHPNGIAFDRRDLSSIAIAALKIAKGEA